MVSLSEKEKLVDELNDILSDISEKDSEQLIQRNKLGEELCFDSGEETFENIFDLVSTLKSLNLSRFPPNSLQNLKGRLTNVQNKIEQIENFSANQSVSDRDNLLNGLSQEHEKLLKSASPILSADIHQKEDLQELKSQWEEKLAALTEQRDEAEKIVENLKETSAEAGVEIHSGVFADEADTFGTKSKQWMIATAAFAAVTIVAVAMFLKFFSVPSSASVPQLVEYSAGRIIVLSVLFYGVVWSSRNYFASKHNEVINKHRQNALETFQTFVNAAEDASTRDAVLEKATETIFGARDSGFQKNQEQLNSPNTIVDIIRNVSSRNNA